MSKEYTRNVYLLGHIPIAGPIVYHDIFDTPLQWTEVGTGGDTIFELDPSISLIGSQSLHMKTRTASAAKDDFILAEKKLFILPSKILSMMGHFYLPSLTTFSMLLFKFEWHFALKVYEVRVAYRPAIHDAWSFYNSAQEYENITGSTAQLIAAGWHRFILKANLISGYYSSLQIDHETFDLSEQAISYPISSEKDHLLIHMMLETVDAAPAEVYLDAITIFEL
jgi:hypothetical protein